MNFLKVVSKCSFLSGMIFQLLIFIAILTGIEPCANNVEQILLLIRLELWPLMFMIMGIGGYLITKDS